MNGQSVNIALLEPFFSGSHERFARGWQAHSRHSIEIIGLQGRFWKWRMRAAALELCRKARELKVRPDLWFAGSLMDVAHFKALMGPNLAPLALYFHECQVSYPLKDGAEPAERDYTYVITDLVSAAAADRVLFNSETLKRAFLEGTREFLRRMPDARPLWLLDEVEEKCEALHLGIDLAGPGGERPERTGPPAILWPHRWEHDKNPEEFFGVLEELAGEGIDFRLLVAGGRYTRVPEVFDRVRTTLGVRIDHWGEVSDRAEYRKLLACADIVVSTARHETFGIAMVEAAAAGAHPLAPRALCYPEIIPEELHPRCLYYGAPELKTSLRALLTGESPLLRPKDLGEIFSRYDWKIRAGEFDRLAGEISQIQKV